MTLLTYPSESSDFQRAADYTIRNEWWCYRDCLSSIIDSLECAKAVESPVEALVFWDLMLRGWASENRAIELSPDYGDVSTKLNFVPTVEITPQKEMTIGNKKYRVDFMAWIITIDPESEPLPGWWQWIAIEIDGHDFHEKTKEQAQRDKARDRAFASIGITVLRFTGSEVWKDPSCVFKALSEKIKNVCVEKYGLIGDNPS